MHVRLRFRSALALACAAALLSTSVVAAPAAVLEDGVSTAAGAVVLVGLVPTADGIGDGGVNDLCNAGLQRAQSQLGVDTQVETPSGAADVDDAVDRLATAGATLVFLPGSGSAALAAQKAAQYPAMAFVVLDEAVAAPASNVLAVSFRTEEAAYLAGVVAGRSNKDTWENYYMDPSQNKIAFIGGVQSPTAESYEAGYVAGARYENASIQISGVYTGSSTDTVKSNAFAKSAISSGVDIILAATGDANTGIVKACQDWQRFCIGTGVDQFDEIPASGDAMLTSAMKRYDNAVFGITSDYVGGDFVGGQTLSLGLAEEGVDLASFHDFDVAVPDYIRTAVAAARQRIVSGTTQVPASIADLVEPTQFQSFAMSPTKLGEYGDSAKITGRLVRGTGTLVPIGSAQVHLQKSTNGTTGWSTVKTLTTNSDGKVSGTYLPRSAGYYRLSYGGAQYRYGAALTASAIKVTPKPFVGIVRANRISTRYYQLYGSLKPRHSEGSKPVRIYRWRKVSGKWKAYSYITATAYDYSSYTRYKVKHKFPYTGTWRLRAYHAADSKHAAEWSDYTYYSVR